MAAQVLDSVLPYGLDTLESTFRGFGIHDTSHRGKGIVNTCQILDFELLTPFAGSTLSLAGVMQLTRVHT